MLRQLINFFLFINLVQLKNFEEQENYKRNRICTNEKNYTIKTIQKTLKDYLK